jgi:hypothetical protein
MKIRNETNHAKIDQAIAYFFKVMPEIIAQLRKLPEMDYDFTFTGVANFSVIAKIEMSFNSDMELVVKPYWSKNPWSAAIGYSDGTNNIYVNMRKIEALTYLDYAGNLAHEWCHVIGYGHGNNSPSPEKDKSVPYAIGNLVSGESSYPLVKKDQEIPLDIVCCRSWKSLWLKKICVPRERV